jgi:hypothetical protein
MKIRWIGQHIWDFISRFRNDVYLENLQSSSETTVLVVDGDGKITKNTVAGPKGDQGDPGPKGDQGDQGPSGTSGAAGTDGTNGSDGAAGAQGPIGLTGATGPQGPQGIQGPKGVDGQNGQDGASGAAGTNGTDGVDGNHGTDGVDGNDGTNGVDGNDGTMELTVMMEHKVVQMELTIGLTGATGPQGPQGTQGPEGPRGIQGIQGPAGNTNFIAYEFNEPLSTWVLEHNLNTYPTVTLTDSNGAVISGNVVYTDSNTITVTFVASKTKDDGPNDVFQKYETPFGVTGFAYIN